MSFSANSGRIIVTQDGVTRFDSDEKLFHIVPPFIEGTVSVPQITGSTGSVTDTTTTTVIGSCHPSCTHVIGAVKITGTGNWGAMFGKWATYMGGTIPYAMASLTGTGGNFIGFNITYVLNYRFEAVGGSVRLVRRVILPALTSSNGHQTPNAKWGPHTIAYKLKCGLWT